MHIGGVFIEDTFAEAFRMRYARLIVTAHDEHWLSAALAEFTGYGSSIIGCDAEIGVETRLTAEQTPDGRVGAAVLIFGFSTEQLAQSVPNRVGQCLMTCPTTAVYDGLGEGEETIPLGQRLRFFGDGFQKSKMIGERRYWRVPVMDGEFLVEDVVHVAKGVAGGNFVIQAAEQAIALQAARDAVEAIGRLPGVITPFPGGVARSGSKVGSRYKGLKASTAEGFCPTLSGRVETKLQPGVTCACEIVLDGVEEQRVAEGMAVGMRAAAQPGVLAISAGNYGGQLGKFHFKLRDLLA